MKKNIIYSTLAALLFTACSNEELVPMDDQSTAGSEITITVGMPADDADTRIAYEDTNLSLQWEDGTDGTAADQLIVVGYKADGSTEQQTFTIKEGSGIKNNKVARFTGNQVKDATHYVVYYKAKNLAVDAAGTATMNYGQQTQTKANDTSHLKDCLFLQSAKMTAEDFMAESFKLANKNAIMKFAVTALPDGLGDLKKITWESNSGTAASQSMDLVVGWTGASKAAFVCFDPATMNLKANGLVKVYLQGTTATMQASSVSAKGLDYKPSQRYTITITNTGAADHGKAGTLATWTAPAPSLNEIWFTTTDDAAPALKANVTDPKYKYTLSAAKNSFGYYELQVAEGNTAPEMVVKEILEDPAKIKDVVLPEGLTTLYSHAFAGCSNLAGIPLPTSLTAIGSSAFEGCTSLSEMTLPKGITRLETCVFYGCKALATINLPEGLSHIGIGAFHGCQSLKGITLPSTLTDLQEHAFASCTGLTSFVVPAQVANLGKNILDGSTNLQQVTIQAPYSTKLSDVTGSSRAYNADAFKGLAAGKVELILDPSWITAPADMKPAGKSWMGNTAWKIITDPAGNVFQDGLLPDVDPDDNSPF